MSDFESEIFYLREKTEQNRREFLRTEVQTCSIALERARLELSLNNSLEARKEYATVCCGIQVIERFLAEARGDTGIEARLAHLKASAESLKLELARYPE
jgi:hypothetical protein